jgi:protoporphyrinogen oxidase
MKIKDILILGAGATGISTAWNLRNYNSEIIIVDREIELGGLSRTLKVDGFHMDIGPHRFFTNNSSLLRVIKNLPGVRLLEVRRLTKFYIKGKYFLYPARIRDVISNLSFADILRIIYDYISGQTRQIFFLRKIENLQDYLVLKFGRSLARMNMINYSEKIWGISCSEISADWAKERINGLSALNLIKNIFNNPGHLKTLRDVFYYPDDGIGSICNGFIKDINLIKNCIIRNQTRPVRISHDGEKITRIYLEDSRQKISEINPDIVVSSIPINELLALFNPKPPDDILECLTKLRFRSTVCLFLIVDKQSVSLNQWIYFPDKEIPFARVSEPRNFSCRMSPEKMTSLIVEFFCWENDKVWLLNKHDLLNYSLSWLERLNLVKKEQIKDIFLHKERSSYPVYDLGYKIHLNKIQDYLSRYKNLYVCGRRGAFLYNNLDDALEDGIRISQNIKEYS